MTARAIRATSPAGAVLFDLDDTLYPERQFVDGGFDAVGRLLAAPSGRTEASLAARLWELHERDGRGRLFDALVEELGLDGDDGVLVAACVHAYRTHRVGLQPFVGVVELFDELRGRGVRTGVVSDGYGAVQARKVAGLGPLADRFDVVVLTDDLGPGHGKPSATPFRVACRLLDVEPWATIYVGNDPRKDFVGARAAGLRTIRMGHLPNEGGGAVIEVRAADDADLAVDFDQCPDEPAFWDDHMTADFTIAGRSIGAGHPVYVIAELSANHRQHEDVAVQLVHAAHEAGADAVKLQTYTPDTITIASDAASFRAGSGSLWEGTTLHDLYQEAYMPWEWQPRLKTLAESLGMDCFSSPFDATAVDFLAALDVPAFKVASFELVDLPLIRRMAATGKPLVISTGMGTEAEIDEAVAAARSAGATDIALLKCTSAYPSPPEAVNLRAIAAMRDRWDVPIGLSDHTLGETVAVGAVALGACIIEKHMRLSSADTSPDSAFSLDKDEFRAMVDAIRVTERALGRPVVGPTDAERESRRFRRSLFVVEDVAAGETLTETNVRSIRPADGLHTRHYDEVLGRRATRAIERGTPLSWDLIEA